MKARNYALERIDRMRPWLVAQVVTQLEYAAAGLDAENGVDVAMMRRAAGRKGIVPLESLDEQAALFASLPPAMQETMLIEILREAQALLAVTRATLAAWEQGDEATLADLLFGNSSQDPAIAEFYERVFYSRNRSMSDRLVALSADGRPRFVVVGTGHLIGTQGIPQLLAQRGFQVERVGSARVLPGAAAQKPVTELPAPAATPAPTATEPQAPVPALAPVVPPVAPPVPATPPATVTQPVPATPPATVTQPVPAPPPAPVTQPLPATPPATVTQPAPTAPPVQPAPALTPPMPSQPMRDIHDDWLRQDAAPDGAVAPAPAPVPVEVQPAPQAVEPAPAPQPAPAQPAAKKRRMSTGKP
jgi:hypothetical protein